MQADSFRGTCINCGSPTAPGAACLNCQDALMRKARGDLYYAVSTTNKAGHIYSRVDYYQQPKKEESMSVQVCQRCGSIGQANDFLSISACRLNGTTLVLPQLITERAYQRGEEEAEEERDPDTSFTLCRNCRVQLRAFLQNEPTNPGTAGPLAPQLPKPSVQES